MGITVAVGLGATVVAVAITVAVGLRASVVAVGIGCWVAATIAAGAKVVAVEIGCWGRLPHYRGRRRKFGSLRGCLLPASVWRWYNRRPALAPAWPRPTIGLRHVLMVPLTTLSYLPTSLKFAGRSGASSGVNTALSPRSLASPPLTVLFDVIQGWPNHNWLKASCWARKRDSTPRPARASTSFTH